MTAESPGIKRLKATAAKAAARATVAKEQVRTAKAHLKQARKFFKVEKKAAKQARRKVEAARAAAASARSPEPKPASSLKPAGAGKPLAKVARVVKRAELKGSAKKISQRRAVKPRAPKAPETMRSAAEVAKTVIERLHALPPVLPPVLPPALAPIVPSEASPIPADP